jgi:hypothetical protein
MKKHVSKRSQQARHGWLVWRTSFNTPVWSVVLEFGNEPHLLAGGTETRTYAVLIKIVCIYMYVCLYTLFTFCGVANKSTWDILVQWSERIDHWRTWPCRHSTGTTPGAFADDLTVSLSLGERENKTQIINLVVGWVGG